VVRVIDADFEDALLLCLDAVEAAGSLEEARDRIVYLLDLYREARHAVRAEAIRAQLGVLHL